jgi:hypothetical protein
MGNMKCATDIKQTFTITGLAGGAFNPGTAVVETTELDGVTKTYIAATGQFIAGVAAGLPTGGGTIPSYASGNTVLVYKNGGQAVVLLASNVTDLTVPLKNNGAGAFVTAVAGDAYCALPLELGNAGEYITVLLHSGVLHA